LKIRRVYNIWLCQLCIHKCVTIVKLCVFLLLLLLLLSMFEQG